MPTTTACVALSRRRGPTTKNLKENSLSSFITKYREWERERERERVYLEARWSRTSITLRCKSRHCAAISRSSKTRDAMTLCCSSCGGCHPPSVCIQHAAGRQRLRAPPDHLRIEPLPSTLPRRGVWIALADTTIRCSFRGHSVERIPPPEPNIPPKITIEQTADKTSDVNPCPCP